MSEGVVLMDQVKPWEELPDDNYWGAILGAPATATPTDGAAAPPTASVGWTRAEASYAQGETLELPIVGYNRGGLLADLGDVRGFVPASQLSAFPRQVSEEERTAALARYVGTTMRVKVIEFDRPRNRLILSERVANPPISRAEQILATIEPAQTRRGTVRNVTDFGAFIDLGGVEGLIHVSELSWQYVAHPRQVLQPGQEVDVYVMEVNREQKRIACSLKRLTPNPWTAIADKLKPGDWTDGTVTSVVAFGAFVRIAEGVEGLLHVSELTRGNNLQPRDAMREGQPVRVRVIEIDVAQQKMKLGLRQPNARGDGADPSALAPAAPAKLPPPPDLDPDYWDNLVKSS
ncbi:MAG: S1 RNA-binding domain-containing protein [Anaerolineales bacterium]|nr:S1 RNA-binding domain-containing protein [Anaerolineales bacterium]